MYVYIHIIMTCGNLIQDFHNIEVIDKTLKEPLDILPLSLSLFKQAFFFIAHPELGLH